MASFKIYVGRNRGRSKAVTLIISGPAASLQANIRVFLKTKIMLLAIHFLMLNVTGNISDVCEIIRKGLSVMGVLRRLE